MKNSKQALLLQEKQKIMEKLLRTVTGLIWHQHHIILITEIYYRYKNIILFSMPFFLFDQWKRLFEILLLDSSHLFVYQFFLGSPIMILFSRGFQPLCNIYRISIQIEMYLKIGKCLPYLKHKFTILAPNLAPNRQQVHARLSDILQLSTQTHYNIQQIILSDNHQLTLKMHTLDDFITLDFIVGEMVRLMGKSISSYIKMCSQLFQNDYSLQDKQSKDEKLNKISLMKETIKKLVSKFIDLIEKLELFNIEFQLREIFVGENGIYSLYRYVWQLDLLAVLAKLRALYSEPKLDPEEMIYQKRTEPFLVMAEEIVYSQSKLLLNQYNKQLYIIPPEWSLELLEKAKLSEIIQPYKSASPEIILKTLLPKLFSPLISSKDRKNVLASIFLLQIEDNFYYYIKYLKTVLLDKVSNFISGDYETWTKVYEISLKIYARKEQIRKQLNFEIDQLLESPKEDQQFMQFLMTCELDTVSLSSMNFFYKNSVTTIKSSLRKRILEKIQGIISQELFRHSQDIFEYLQNEASEEEQSVIISLYSELIQKLINKQKSIKKEDCHHMKKMFEDLTYFLIKSYNNDNKLYLNKFLNIATLKEIIKVLKEDSLNCKQKELFTRFVYIFLNTMLISCYEEQIEYQVEIKEEDDDDEVRSQFGNFLLEIIKETVSDEHVYHEDVYAFVSEFVPEEQFDNGILVSQKDLIEEQDDTVRAYGIILEEVVKLMLINGKQSDYKLQNYYLNPRKQKIADVILNLFRKLSINQIQQRKSLDLYLKQQSQMSSHYIVSYLHIIGLKNRILFDNLINMAIKISPELPFIETAVFAFDFINVFVPEEFEDSLLEESECFPILDTVAGENPIECLKLIYKKVIDYEDNGLIAQNSDLIPDALYPLIGMKNPTALIECICKKSDSTLDILDVDSLSELKKLCVYMKLMSIVFSKLNERSQKGVKQIRIIYEKFGKIAVQKWQQLYPKYLASEITSLNLQQQQFQNKLKDHQKYLENILPDKNSLCMEDVQEILLTKFAKVKEIPVIGTCLIQGNFIMQTFKQFITNVGKIVMPDTAYQYLIKTEMPFLIVPKCQADRYISDCLLMFNVIETVCSPESVLRQNSPDKFYENMDLGWLKNLQRLVMSLNQSISPQKDTDPLQIVNKTLTINLKAELIKILIPFLIKLAIHTKETSNENYSLVFKIYEMLCEIIEKISGGEQEHFLILLEMIENIVPHSDENSDNSSEAEAIHDKNRSNQVSHFILKGIQTLFRLVFKGIRVRSYHLFKFIKKYCKQTNQKLESFNTLIAHFIHKLFSQFVHNFKLPQSMLSYCDQKLLKNYNSNELQKTISRSSSFASQLSNQTLYHTLTQFSLVNFNHSSTPEFKIQKIRLQSEHQADLSNSQANTPTKSLSIDKQNHESPKFRIKRKKSINQSVKKKTRNKLIDVLSQEYEKQNRDEVGNRICLLSMFINLFCRLNYKSLNQGISGMWENQSQKLMYLDYLINLTPMLAKNLEQIEKRDNKTLDIIDIDCYGNLQIIVKGSQSQNILLKVFQLCQIVIKQSSIKPSSQLNLKSRVTNSLKHPLSILNKALQTGQPSLQTEINKLNLNCSLHSSQFADLMQLLILSNITKLNKGIQSNLLICNLTYLLEEASESIKQRIIQRNYRNLKMKNNSFELLREFKNQNRGFVAQIEIKVDRSCEKLIHGLIENFIQGYLKVFPSLSTQNAIKTQSQEYLFNSLKLLAVCATNHPQLLLYFLKAHPFSTNKSIYRCVSVYDIMLDSAEKSVEVFAVLFSLFLKNNLCFVNESEQESQKQVVPYSIKIEDKIRHHILRKLRENNHQVANRGIQILLKCLQLIITQSNTLRLSGCQIPKFYNSSYEEILKNYEQKWVQRILSELYWITSQQSIKLSGQAIFICAEIFNHLLASKITETQYEHLKVKLEKNLWDDGTYSKIEQEPIHIYYHRLKHPSVEILSSQFLVHRLCQFQSKQKHQHLQINYEALPQTTLLFLKDNEGDSSQTFMKMEMEYISKCAIKQMEDLDKMYECYESKEQLRGEQINEEVVDEGCDGIVENDCIVDNGNNDDGIVEREEDDEGQYIMENFDYNIRDEIEQDKQMICDEQEDRSNKDSQTKLISHEFHFQVSPSDTSLEFQSSLKIVQQQPIQETIHNQQNTKQHLVHLYEDAAINPESLKQLLAQIPLTSTEHLFNFIQFLQSNISLSQIHHASLSVQNMELLQAVIHQFQRRDIKSTAIFNTISTSTVRDNLQRMNKVTHRIYINEQQLYHKMMQNKLQCQYYKFIPNMSLQTLDQLHRLSFKAYLQVKELDQVDKKNMSNSRNTKKCVLEKKERNMIEFVSKWVLLNKDNYKRCLSYYIGVIRSPQQGREFKQYVINCYLGKMIENQLGLAPLFYGRITERTSEHQKEYSFTIQDKQTENEQTILAALISEPSLFINTNNQNFSTCLLSYIQKVMQKSHPNSLNQTTNIYHNYPYYPIQQQITLPIPTLSSIVQQLYTHIEQKGQTHDVTAYVNSLMYIDPNFFTELCSYTIGQIASQLNSVIESQMRIFDGFQKRMRSKSWRLQSSSDNIINDDSKSEISETKQVISQKKTDPYKLEQQYWKYRLEKAKKSIDKAKFLQKLTNSVKFLTFIHTDVVPQYKNMKFLWHYSEENSHYLKQIDQIKRGQGLVMREYHKMKKQRQRIRNKETEYEIWKKCSIETIFNEQILPCIEDNSDSFSSLLPQLQAYITTFVQYFRPSDTGLKTTNNSDSIFSHEQNQKATQQQSLSIIYQTCSKFYEIILSAYLLTSCPQELSYHSMSKLKTVPSIVSMSNIRRKSVRRTSHKLSISPISFKMASFQKPEYILKRMGHLSSFLYGYLTNNEKIKGAHTKFCGVNKIRFLWEKSKSGNKTAKKEKVIECRREYILEDSLSQIDEEFINADTLKIKFSGEIGIDYGGVTREWVTLIIKKLTDPNLGLFELNVNGLAVQPRSDAHILPNYLTYYEKMGIIVGKAMQENWLLQLNLTKSFLKHLLGGVLYVEDLQDMDPHTAKSLLWILNTQIEEDDLGLTFTHQKSTFFGDNKTIEQELLPGGKEIYVNQENKKQYIKLLANKKMTEDIREQSKAFMRGLQAVIPYQTLNLYSYKQISLYLSGVPIISVEEMKKSARYQNFNEESNEVKWFWEIMEEWSNANSLTEQGDNLGDFLFFLTGSYKVPYGGFNDHPIGINKMVGCKDYLPVAHTCFSVIDLSEFSSKKKMEYLLRKAIKQGKGFTVS